MSAKQITRSFVSMTSDFASGSSSPRAVLEQCIERIEAREHEVKAFIHLNLQSARSLADEAGKRWKAGNQLSAFDGMPVGVKDIIETEDFPTEMGSALFVGWSSERDAAVVKALRSAGAVIVGKTDTTEFAAATPNKARNPWDVTRTPGGSSSGSAAAVAAGFLPLAIGTQVVGSILRPSSFCGTIGYKPSVGGINRGGSHDFHSQSCTGTIAATVEDNWVVARDIAWRAGGDPGFPGIAGPALLPPSVLPGTIAVFQTPGWAVAEPAAIAAFDVLGERLAAAGVKLLSRRTSALVEEIEHDLEQCNRLTRRINAFESRWPYNVYAGMDRTKMSPAAIERLEIGFSISAEDYRIDLQERARVRASYMRLSAVASCSIALSAKGAAPVGMPTGGESNVFPVCGSNLGIPAWGLPVLEVDGLPLGMQLWGYQDRDADLAGHAGALMSLLGSAPI